MKATTLIVFLFFTITSNARYVDCILRFNDGHEEKGLIKSFLEEKWFDMSLSSTVEEELNFDDKNLFFKTDKKAEARKISINEIKEVVLLGDKGEQYIYRVLLLKKISADGTISKKEKKVYLPLLKEGKINIYGYRYKERQIMNGMSLGSSVIEVFYYQNANDNYVLVSDSSALSVLGSVFSGNLKKKMAEFVTNPLKDLFKDCKELVDKLNNASNPLVADDKNSREEFRARQKEFKKLSSEERNNLLTIHAYQYYAIEKLIEEYQKCN